MMPTPRLDIVVGAFALAGTVLLAACGSNGSGANSPELSPIAAEGRSIADTNGCAACHGVNGQGGVGPPFVGLFGSTVELDDGSTLVADREYLIESIVDPDAKKVASFLLQMPANRLTSDEVDRVVAYIEELAAPRTGSTP